LLQVAAAALEQRSRMVVVVEAVRVG